MGDANQTQRQVAEAASLLAPLPSIYRFAASNPLDGFLGMQFEEALAVSRELLGSEDQPSAAPHQLLTLSELLDRDDDCTDLTAKINTKVVRYVGAYCDKTQAQWSMERSGGLLKSWRLLVQHDWSLSRRWKKILFEELSESSLAALGQLLERLGVNDVAAPNYLRRHLFQLPGWASHLKWRQTQGEDSLLTEYLVMRLFYELAVAQPVVEKRFSFKNAFWMRLKTVLTLSRDEQDVGNSSPQGQRSFVHKEEEIVYRDQLLTKLGRHSSNNVSAQKPDVQICFCLDVREERFRRQLEIAGGNRYKTYGAAGFFGVQMKLTESGSKMSRSLAPIMCTPVKNVQEVNCSKLQISRHALLAFSIMLQKKLKANLASAFGFVDIVGPVYAFALLFRTFFPGLVQHVVRASRDNILDIFQSEGVSEKARSTHTHLNISSFSLDEKVALAHGFLASIGLTDNFSDIVVFCGHESSSSNNPYAAALDCGACGGNTGKFNARVLADILNHEAVRDGLVAKNVIVPVSTIFVGAVHNTGTDQVELFKGALPESHKYAMSFFEADLEAVGEKVRSEREAVLPRALFDRFNDPARRSCDPAQVIPELGLLGNRAMIIGSRSLTRELNLEGQVFLHSYEWESDPDSAVLQGIVSGALVVASGINMQYYTSSIDNKSFGSGNKVTLNPFGGIGVMQGLRGDLKIGLTEQSVQVQDGLPKDVPLRLLVVIRAPLIVIDKAVLGDATVVKLVNNGWLNLVAFEPSTNTFHQCNRVSDWRKLTDLFD
jgi:uncharacterized protein YbcC (UPF0753/DUF2309 family)